MFGKTFRLPFRLLGIPVYVDLSFLIILPLLAWLIAAQIPMFAQMFGMADERPLLGGAMPLLLGLISAVGLFICVVLHELGHSIVARAYGVEVKNITLWFLGGVAQFEEMPRRAGAEAVIAIAGPLVSFALAFLCAFVARAVPASAPATDFVFHYLAYINVVVAVFNLLPALPLDGGRVLRSLLALVMPHPRATAVSASISKFLAILLGVGGFFVLHSIWLVVIAFFIYMAVNAETQQSVASDLLAGVMVRDLMTRDVITVPPQMTVAELKTKMLQDHHLGFPVTDGTDGQVAGIVTLRDLQGAGPSATVGEVMSRQVATIGEDQSADAAFQKMSRNNFGRLIVTDPSGHMVGILSKTDLMHAIQVRATGMASPSGSQDRYNDLARA